MTSKALKMIFAGTPAFSAVTLQALLDSPHDVIAVYTQPDRPAGRGRKLTASPVKSLALQANLPVYQPLTLVSEDEQKIIAEMQADVMVVVAYGLLLPQAILNAPRLGCINIHGSLLPRWRGAAPIQRAILTGDSKTGITIMQMDKGLDTGAMLHTVECDILASDTSETLYEKLAVIGATAVLETVNQLAAGAVVNPIPQNNDDATYAHKIKKEEADLNWQLPAVVLERAIRAFNPWPICQTRFNDQVLRVWEATVIPTNVATYQPGEVLAISPLGLDIATGHYILRLQKLQLPGGRVLPVADILNSRQLNFSIGNILGQYS